MRQPTALALVLVMTRLRNVYAVALVTAASMSMVRDDPVDMITGKFVELASVAMTPAARFRSPGVDR